MFPTDIRLTEFAFWDCLETAGLYILRYVTSNEFCFCSFFGFSGSHFDMLELLGEEQECLRSNALFLPKTELQSVPWYSVFNNRFRLLASPAFTWSLQSLIPTLGSCHCRWDEVATQPTNCLGLPALSMADTYKQRQTHSHLNLHSV